VLWVGLRSVRRRRRPRRRAGALIEPCAGVACGEPFSEAAAWSPDGSTIAWVDFVEDSARFGQHATTLSFVAPDGTDLRAEVAELPEGSGSNLAWSPDGTRLVFSASGQDGPGGIFVIDADGTGLRRLTRGKADTWPAWSPDGSRIAFVRDGVLHTMAADGSDVREVEGVRVDGEIAWNPAA
jgi:TolB protein